MNTEFIYKIDMFILSIKLYKSDFDTFFFYINNSYNIEFNLSVKYNIYIYPPISRDVFFFIEILNNSQYAII